jgi:hypothetical protein
MDNIKNSAIENIQISIPSCYLIQCTCHQAISKDWI